MTKLFCVPVACLAAIGFLASAAVNLSFWVGHPIFPAYHDFLLKGIFVVHIPTVLVMIALSRQHGQARSWAELLRGSPTWIKPALIAVAAYAGINFSLGLVGAFDLSGENFFRIGSSHAMAFYAAGFAINIAAIVRSNDPAPAPCERGHEMPREAEFCPRCGAGRQGEHRARDA